jgi:hypothetical protein
MHDLFPKTGSQFSGSCFRTGPARQKARRAALGGGLVRDWQAPRLECGSLRDYLEGRPIAETFAMDEKTRTELEAAAFRRLLEHLRTRTDVQNIDMMNLAGFCRNCLSNWMKEAADAKGVPMTKDQSREAIYGMPFEDWKAKYQKEAGAEKLATFEKARPKH